MEKVLGFGGFFFRATDPKRLARWYQDHLGVDLTPMDGAHAPWQQQGGPTAFQPFPQKTSYFGNPEKQWMLNFRVRDLAAMVRQLQAAGITVKVDPRSYPNGLFAHLTDPEGNPIELWEPRGRSAAGKKSGR